MYNFDIIAAGEYISIGRRVQSTSRISRSTAELLLYFSQLYSQQYMYINACIAGGSLSGDL